MKEKFFGTKNYCFEATFLTFNSFKKKFLQITFSTNECAKNYYSQKISLS